MNRPNITGHEMKARPVDVGVLIATGFVFVTALSIAIWHIVT